MMTITVHDVHKVIIQLVKTNNLFSIKYQKKPFSEEVLQGLVIDFNEGNLSWSTFKVFLTGLGKGLLKLDMTNIDFLKCRLLSHAIEFELLKFQRPNSSYETKEIDNIIPQVKKWKSEDKYILITDIKSFFSSISYEEILNSLSFFGVSHQLVIYVNRFYESYKVAYDQMEAECTTLGLPIGVKLSYVLANLILLQIDDLFFNDNRNAHYARFIDDIYFSHNDLEYLENTYQIMEEKLSAKSLRINKQKTKIYSRNEDVIYLRHNL